MAEFSKEQILRASTTVLIRTGNRPLFLPRALASIAGQTDRDWCVWVLNDGERGSAEEIVAPFAEKFPGRVGLQHLPRAGSATLVNLNFGVEKSAGEFVAIHDDDDTWEPEFLEKSISALRAQPEAGGCVSKCFQVREEIVNGDICRREKNVYNEWQAHQISLFRLAESLTFPPISLLIRRSALEAVGPFKAYPALLGDWEFCLRLFSRFPAAFVPEPLANYHHHGENESLAGLRSTYEREGIEFRNHLLREDLKSGKPGLGFLVNLSHAHGHLYQQIESLRGGRG